MVTFISSWGDLQWFLTVKTGQIPRIKTRGTVAPAQDRRPFAASPSHVSQSSFTLQHFQFPYQLRAPGTFAPEKKIIFSTFLYATFSLNFGVTVYFYLHSIYMNCHWHSFSSLPEQSAMSVLNQSLDFHLLQTFSTFILQKYKLYF